MEPAAFLDLATLKTLAGQVLAVGMVTQTVKSALPELATYWLRFTAVASGIGLHMVLVWQSGMGAEAYALALINGVLVSLSAMKATEMVKGQ